MIRNYLIGGAIALATPTVIAQPVSAQGIAVTNVQIDQTQSGLELILESPTGKQPETFRTTYGETLIIDLINTQLQLPEGEQISQQNPAPGIASVEVVQQYANTVRVKLVGTEEVPTAKVNTTPQGLALNVSTEMTTAQEPPPGPTPETTPTPQQPEAGQQEPIELVVTATRTEERQEDVARSVTVIDREEIEEQTNLGRNLINILGRTVPGLGPPNFDNRSNAQTLRGREFSVLIDGVPSEINRSANTQLSFIDPSAIERIEVVRGPTAIFGGDAVGGVINIITRSPTEEGFKATTEIGTDAALGNLEGESFGNEQRQTLFYNQGDFDLTLTLSREQTETSFDAEGDRRPSRNSNTEFLNVLGKVGVDLDKNQRLEFTTNYRQNDIGFELLPIANPDPGGKVLVEERDFEFVGDATEPGIDNTVINLEYTHDDLLGSEVKLQGFYRTLQSAGVPIDDRGGFFDAVLNGRGDEQVWGGRLQAETPLSPGTDLLWGADFESQDNEGRVFEVFDPEAFDEQDEFRTIDAPFSGQFGPSFQLNELGLFAQVQSQLNQKLRLSGGVRYNRFDFQVDDFVPIFDGEFNIIGEPDFNRRTIEGGELNFDDVTFNAGAVYQLTPELNVFGKFSQGFSVPDFSDVLDFPPSGFAVSDSFQDLQPVKVDEFELGIRGNWSSVQFSVAGFFNQSDLGSSVTTITNDEGDVEVITERAPERIYGVEATIDAQLSKKWQVGGLVSWNEGENDPNDDGDFQPLSSFEIQPLKLSAYVQNQTTPGWNNRLQLLVVGGRDRAFEEGVDNAEIESYMVLDYISNVDIGPGTLEIGIQNLLDNQYLPVFRQVAAGNNPTNRIPAPGRTIRLNYSLTW
jgi:iron complex outermembrane receptor protein